MTRRTGPRVVCAPPRGAGRDHRRTGSARRAGGFACHLSTQPQGAAARAQAVLGHAVAPTELATAVL